MKLQDGLEKVKEVIDEFRYIASWWGFAGIAEARQARLEREAEMAKANEAKPCEGQGVDQEQASGAPDLSVKLAAKRAALDSKGSSASPAPRKGPF
jgi:hypothetical protein